MTADGTILVATAKAVLIVDADGTTPTPAAGLQGRAPTCLASSRVPTAHAWCGTKKAGVLRSVDAGRTWKEAGLDGEHVTAVAASPVDPDLVWAGTEPSALWRSGDGGRSWKRAGGLRNLPSAEAWSFPPRPDTHHVRWIACHPSEEGRLWLAIEAGALVATPDGGATWTDRGPAGPRDTHEIAIHPEEADTLRVAAGDGYYESTDGGETWRAPDTGLEVGYLRSVAVDPGDPGTVVVSAASRARSAYEAGVSDGRLYRRSGNGPWRRVLDGWPDPPATVAPLLVSGRGPGEVWAADERGVHRTGDGARSWSRVVGYDVRPSHLRGLALLPTRPV